jgi:integrase/recombinase XerD
VKYGWFAAYTRGMIVLYRRHRKDCQYRSRKERRCHCPIYAEGSVGNEYLKRSLDLTSWEAAQRKVREWESAGTLHPKEEESSITTAEALEKFIRDCASRNLNDATFRKYRLLKNQLSEFCRANGIYALSDFSAELTRDFRNGWTLSPRTAAKHLERLRSFFRFCLENEWLKRNPASALKPPKVKLLPRLPFSEAEVQKILGKARTLREQAFVLTLRHSGLRIGDASLLKVSDVHDTRLYLYTTKAGVPVHIVLPPELVNLLKSIEPRAGYFFLRGDSTKMHTTANLWRRSVERMCKDASVSPGHPHRFRHTLAVDLLSNGASVEEVAAVLGNSPAVVSKYYSQWVKTRQDRLDSLLEKTWQTRKLVLVK